MAIFYGKTGENLLRAKSVAIVGASQKGAWPLGIYQKFKGREISRRSLSDQPKLYRTLW